MPRRKSNVVGPTYHTTHQVAKFLGVSLPTVVNWVNQGLLPAHRTPGGHRRIARNDIISFAREHEYPLSREFLEQTGATRKVLIVDDERDFAEMVRDYLALKGGFDVGVAESGFQAGFTVARFRPDVILMDIMMPDMDGFEVYRMLRDDPETRHIPVVACTAYRDPAIDRRVREEQFDGLVEKPLKLDDLLELIRRQLGLTEEPEEV
jgi:excisionase family DNA binding protein